jgi:hypothetical protein
VPCCSFCTFDTPNIVLGVFLCPVSVFPVNALESCAELCRDT